MFISPTAALRPFDLVAGASDTARFPKGGGSREAFFSRGCGALETLLRSRARVAGERVLVPSYLCGEVIEIFERTSVPFTLYAIDASGRFDLSELSRTLVPPIRTVYVVHYFGFQQDIQALRRLADERGVTLIEDCAHALFGRHEGRWLGEFGHAAVFSLRKTLPLPDGGALVVESGSLPPSITAGPPAALTTASRVARLTAKAALSAFGWRPRMSRGPVAAIPASAADVESPHEMSAVARRGFRAADVAAFTERRRANFRYYLERLDRVALYRELPDGVVPFSFPVLVPNRDHVIRQLTYRGLSLNMGFPEAPVVGSAGVAGVDLSGAKYLAAHLLELPLHQDLLPKHLDYVIEHFTRAC